MVVKVKIFTFVFFDALLHSELHEGGQKSYNVDYDVFKPWTISKPEFTKQKHKRTWPPALTPSIILSLVSGEPQHTEELWESEFSWWLKCEVMLLQRGQVMQFVS